MGRDENDNRRERISSDSISGIPSSRLKTAVEGRAGPYWEIARSTALVAAISCWASFLAIALWIWSGGSSQFDDAGIAIFRSNANLGLVGPAWVAEGVRDVTALGGVLLRNLFAIIAVVSLLTLGFRRQAAALFLTVAAGWALGFALKILFMRARPDALPRLMEADGFSFPSGHSFNAAVICISIAMLLAGVSQRCRVRRAIITAAVMLCVVIGVSRVALGVHFPTDVIAGLAGGAGWAFLCKWLFHAHS